MAQVATRASIRKLLGQLLITDADFEAFVLDYFPAVKRRFTDGQDRVKKTTLLLELVDGAQILRRLRGEFPDGITAYEGCPGDIEDHGSGGIPPSFRSFGMSLKFHWRGIALGISVTGVIAVLAWRLIAVGSWTAAGNVDREIATGVPGIQSSRPPLAWDNTIASRDLGRAAQHPDFGRPTLPSEGPKKLYKIIARSQLTGANDFRAPEFSPEEFAMRAADLGADAVIIVEKRKDTAGGGWVTRAALKNRRTDKIVVVMRYSHAQYRGWTIGEASIHQLTLQLVQEIEERLASPLRSVQAGPDYWVDPFTGKPADEPEPSSSFDPTVSKHAIEQADLGRTACAPPSKLPLSYLIKISVGGSGTLTSVTFPGKEGDPIARCFLVALRRLTSPNFMGETRTVSCLLKIERDATLVE